MAEFLDQSYTAGADNQSLGNGGNVYDSQSFTPSRTGKLTRISAELKIGAGSPTGTVYCYLYSNNGGKPGSVLATYSTLNSATVTAGYAWYDFTLAFGSAPKVIAGQVYHIVLYMAATVNYLHTHFRDASSGYDGGWFNQSTDGASWAYAADPGKDMNFKQYYTPVAEGFQGYIEV